MRRTKRGDAEGEAGIVPGVLPGLSCKLINSQSCPEEALELGSGVPKFLSPGHLEQVVDLEIELQ